MKKDNKFIIWYLLGSEFLIPVIIGLLFIIIYGGLLKPNGLILNEEEVLDKAITYGMYIGTFVLAVIIYRYYGSEIIKEFKEEKNRKKWVITILIATTIVVAVDIITSIGFSALGYGVGENQKAAAALANENFFLMFIAAVIIAPFAEELFFRYIIQKKLMRFGKVVAILGSSIIFALVHFGGPLIILTPYFISGLVLGVLYYKTKKLTLVIGIHMLNNLVAMILFY